jgi:hypothetical protein
MRCSSNCYIGIILTAVATTAANINHIASSLYLLRTSVLLSSAITALVIREMPAGCFLFAFMTISLLLGNNVFSQ